MPGDWHVRFGGRVGETHREQSRQGAPTRPNGHPPRHRLQLRGAREVAAPDVAGQPLTTRSGPVARRGTRAGRGGQPPFFWPRGNPGFGIFPRVVFQDPDSPRRVAGSEERRNCPRRKPASEVIEKSCDDTVRFRWNVGSRR